MNTAKLVIKRRRWKDEYTQLPNCLLRNKQLGLRAVGLLSYLLSLPNNFGVSVKGLSNILNEGQGVLRSVINELEEEGYMKMIRSRTEGGRFGYSTWVVSDEKIMDWSPYTENPCLVDQDAVSPDVINGKHIKKEFNKINNNRNHIKTITTTAGAPHVEPITEPGSYQHEAVEEQWLWLCKQLSVKAAIARQASVGVDLSVAVDVLVEVLSLKEQGQIKTSPIQLMRSLFSRAHKGTFALSAGIEKRRNLDDIILRHKAVSPQEPVRPRQDAREEKLEEFNRLWDEKRFRNQVT